MSTSKDESIDRKTHENICSQIHIEGADVRKSWESYSEINHNYSLDGNPLHWLACAIYVANQDNRNQKYPKPLDFTKFLRLHNISVIQFFDKMKKWIDMATVSDEFRLKLEKLEAKVTVSILLFKKFTPMFNKIFADGNELNKRSQRKTKSSLNYDILFELTWCLFICVKRSYKETSDNLVDMFHILLSCLDYIFENVFQAQKVHLLNPEFNGLPPNFWDEGYEFPPNAPCIMTVLSEMYECSTIEAISSKQFGWKPIIDSFFFEKKILQGDKKTLTGILDLYSQNLNLLTNYYELNLFKGGDFDERIFLDPQANTIIGTTNNPTKEEFVKSNTFGVKAQDTPLTGRGYLRRAEPLTPISAATNNIARLRNYLFGSKMCPSQKLIDCLREEKDLDTEEILNHLMVTECKSWMQQIASLFQFCGTPNAVNSRTNIVATLHYKVLEEILFMEKQKKPQVSLLRLLEKPELQRSIFACCTEICVRAFGSTGKFPRVLQLLNLPAFNFYKVIELVVLVLMDKMTRDVIKHLNAIEEQVLESLVWTSDSPLWARLDNGEPVPPSCEVVESAQRRQDLDAQSPVSVVPDRLQLAIENAKKQLFQDNHIKPGQSLLVKERLNISPPSPMKNKRDDSTPTTPRKNGSLGLFFRKFYSLAVARVSDLCQRLRLPDETLRTKVWTCLEHSLRNYTHLMRDRHLDQILMCTVYVICKVSSTPSNPVECTFTEIMRCYRQQPQADNHVYRSVLISGNERGDLIKFYNTVYVQCMQSFALKFTGKHKEECPLSPLPAGRGAVSPVGARRVSAGVHHRLFVRPLPPASPPPHTHLAYCVSRSPAQDLIKINTMLSGGKKRTAEEESSVVKRPCTQPGVTRKLHGLLMDRQTV